MLPGEYYSFLVCERLPPLTSFNVVHNNAFKHVFLSSHPTRLTLVKVKIMENHLLIKIA